MNNIKLYNKIDFKSLFDTYDKKKYIIGNGVHYLNLFVVRANTGFTNTFDDIAGVFYKNAKDIWTLKKWDCTVDPGRYYLENLMNPKGTGIIVPNQYLEVYEIGLHKGENALVQRGNLSVYRDKNKDLTYNKDPKTIETGLFAIDIHNANNLQKSTYVNNWSAACVVLPDPNEHKELMSLAKTYFDVYRPRLAFTLFDELELL